MGQIFRPAADTILKFALSSLAALPVLLLGTAYAVMRSPYVTGQDVVREQPVPFSHKHHVGELGLDCRYCHSSVEKTRFAGMPPTETCMTCHSQLWTQAPMLAPVRESLQKRRPIAWKRVHNLPEYVYFDHAIHVTKGVGCSTCHGPVDKMPLMRQAAPLTMSWCLDCHRDPAPNLRPLDRVYDMTWKPPADQPSLGAALMAKHHVVTTGLTDCSTCHR